MIKLIQFTLIAGVLSACAATNDGRRSSAAQPSNSAQADLELVDAVTRRPLEPSSAEPAPVAAEPPVAVPAPQPQPTPQPAITYSGAPIEQIIDPELDPSTARSYNATWEDGGFRHRSVMFPHIIDGCKVMIQSRRTLDYVTGTTGEFFEREGPDCNCDLIIDGFEDVFAQLNDEYKTPRMYDVCAGPGVDGATRQLEIMRETLKEERNFDKMKNVDGF